MRPTSRGMAMGLLAGTLFVLCADPFLSPPDCSAYWTWAESLFRRLDFEFHEPFAWHAMPTRYTYITETGRLANDWPPGSGLLLGPWVLAGRVLAHAWVAMVALGALLLWGRAVGRDARERALVLAAVVLGTPVGFYLLFGPFFSHAMSFAATTAFLVCWERTRGARSAAEAALLGLLLGVATMVRPQNALLAVVLLVELPGWWRRRAWNPRALLLFVAGGLLGMAPLLATTWALYGSPLALPKVEEMRWLRPALGGVLFSDYHGVLTWTPLYAIGAVGLVVLGRRDRALAVGLGLVLLAQLWVNAANLVWWSGGSFGNRRLSDSAIVLAWGLAALWRSARGRGRGWSLLLALAVAACCAWTVLLMIAERAGVLPLGHYVPFDRKFFGELLPRVATEPLATLRGLVRGPWSAEAVGQRLLGGLLVGGAVACANTWGGRLRRDHAPQAMRLATGAAAVLAVVVGVAAGRTGPATDPELIRSVGTQPGVLWDNYLELAYYELLRDNYVASEEAARRMLDIWSGHHSGWLALGRALYEQGRYASAEEALVEALRLDPDNAVARGVLNLTRARLTHSEPGA
ncbi:MAG: tetratricopeptide repeat protein [Candidatus Sumerlaeia bacterium]|nr:tetratricopeptide repeat protein [Candidatus Sumerlaeia bacterium]